MKERLFAFRSSSRVPAYAFSAASVAAALSLTFGDYILDKSNYNPYNPSRGQATLNPS
jgi:hypothetical protein